MTYFEIITLSFSGVTTLAMIIATLIGLRNLRLLVKAHSDNHEWNRRLATQNAIAGIRVMKIDTLNKEFGYANQLTSIPLKVVLKKFKDNHELQILCNNLLNYYEGLAAGIHLGIYDELTVKVIRKGTMERDFAKFREYITYRRDQVSDKAWIEQEKLVAKWRAEVLTKSDRPATGEL